MSFVLGPTRGMANKGPPAGVDTNMAMVVCATITFLFIPKPLTKLLRPQSLAVWYPDSVVRALLGPEPPFCVLPNEADSGVPASLIHLKL